MSIVRIRCSRPGRRRAGLRHPAGPVDHPAERFTAAEQAALRADPVLTVEILDPPPAETPATEPPPAEAPPAEAPAEPDAAPQAEPAPEPEPEAEPNPAPEPEAEPDPALAKPTPRGRARK